MKRYLIEINAVSSDGEKRNYEHIVEAESIVDAFNKFDQTLDAAEIRRFRKNGYCNLSCHWMGTKGTMSPERIVIVT